MADALTAIKADGTYDKLFDKFGMTKLKATTLRHPRRWPGELRQAAEQRCAVMRPRRSTP